LAASFAFTARTSDSPARGRRKYPDDKGCDAKF
jgi:hypothetical protein